MQQKKLHISFGSNQDQTLNKITQRQSIAILLAGLVVCATYSASAQATGLCDQFVITGDITCTIASDGGMVINGNGEINNGGTSTPINLNGGGKIITGSTGSITIPGLDTLSVFSFSLGSNAAVTLGRNTWSGGSISLGSGGLNVSNQSTLTMGSGGSLTLSNNAAITVAASNGVINAITVTSLANGTTVNNINIGNVEAIKSSINSVTTGLNVGTASALTVLHGAHSRPLEHRVTEGKDLFWLAGDLGRDDHGNRNGNLGLAEIGIGRNFGSLQMAVALGETRANQSLPLSGKVEADGRYLLIEALAPVYGNLWSSMTAYAHRGDADIRRGYVNGAGIDHSRGNPDMHTWGIQARAEWDQAYTLIGMNSSPYLDVSYAKTTIDGYTETGGGFPNTYDKRKEGNTEIRAGINMSRPTGIDNVQLVGIVEAVHRLEKTGTRVTGNTAGLFGFSIPGQAFERDWWRLGVGVDGQLASGKVSLMLNATTRGEALSSWLAASYVLSY